MKSPQIWSSFHPFVAACLVVAAVCGRPALAVDHVIPPNTVVTVPPGNAATSLAVGDTVRVEGTVLATGSNAAITGAGENTVTITPTGILSANSGGLNTANGVRIFGNGIVINDGSIRTNTAGGNSAAGINIGSAGTIINNGSIVTDSGAGFNAAGISTGGLLLPNTPMSNILNNGSIDANGGFFARGIAANAGGATVVNNGTITTHLTGGPGSFGGEGIVILGPGAATNNGTIVANGNGGDFVNGISIGGDGVGTGQTVSVFNNGWITSNGSTGNTVAGIILFDDGTVVNTGQVVATGTGTNAQGILLLGDGTLINSGSVFSANDAGVQIVGQANVVNSGQILSAGELTNGLQIDDFGMVTNQATGLIQATGPGSSAVEFGFLNTGQPSSLVNFGRLFGVADAPAVLFLGATGDTLVNTGQILGGGQDFPTVDMGDGDDTFTNGNGSFGMPSLIGAWDPATAQAALQGNGLRTLLASTSAFPVVALGGGNDAATLQASSIIGGVLDGGDGIDTLTLNLPGLSMAALDLVQNNPSAGSVFWRGITISWENFESINASGFSFEAAGRTPGQRSLGHALDNISLYPEADFILILDALDQAGPQRFPGLADILGPIRLAPLADIPVVNSLFRSKSIENGSRSLMTMVTPRIINPIDSSGLRLNDPTLHAMAQDTQRQLADLSASQRMMSDSGPLLYSGIDVSPRVVADEKGMLVHDKLLEDDKKMFEAPFVPSWGVWVAGSGIFADGDAIAETGQFGFDYDTATALVGFDYLVLPELAVGIVGSYANTDADLDGLGSTLDLNSYGVGPYVNYVDGGWHAHGLFTYGWNDYESERVIVLPGINRTAQGDPSGEEYTARAAGGYDFTFGDFRIGPAAALQYTHVEVDGFNETGAGTASLLVGEQEAESLRSELGGRTSYDWHACPDVIIVPSAHASWVHEFLDDSRGITSQFNTTGVGSFVFPTADPDRDYAYVGAAVSALVGNQWTAWVGYDAQAGQDDFFAQQVAGGARFEF